MKQGYEASLYSRISISSLISNKSSGLGSSSKGQGTMMYGNRVMMNDNYDAVNSFKRQEGRSKSPITNTFTGYKQIVRNTDSRAEMSKNSSQSRLTSVLSGPDVLGHLSSCKYGEVFF